MSRIGRSGVRHTCPSIDKVIREIKSAIQSAEWGILNPESEYAKDNYNDIINNLENLESIMEEIRSDNTELREFGEEQYNNPIIVA